MRYIVRSQSPNTFERWKQNNPTANWNDFSGNVKSNLKTTLIDQQDDLCGYCEKVIVYNESHVEHLKDRHNYPQNTFDFNNFLASCNGLNNDSCGHKKDDGYFVGFVSPFDKDCEKRFTYTGTGKIIPVDENDNNTRRTIEVLCLNCKRLKNMRISIIKTLEKSDVDDIDECLLNYKDWFGGFYTVVKYVKSKN